MAKSVHVVITGDKELNQALRALSKGEARKVVRTASRAAIKPLLPKIKAAAPKQTGALARSLAVRSIKKSRTRIGVMITTRAGHFQGDTFYGGFQEWGWKAGKDKKKIQGKKFMKRVVDSNRQSVLSNYRGLCHAGILAEIRKRTK